MIELERGIVEMEQMLRIGVITSTHGIKGEVKVFPTTDDVNRYKVLKTALLENGKTLLELEIETIRFFKKYVILKFKGIDDINQVEIYKGKDLFVTRENAVALKEDEHFICDLIGFEVITDDDNRLGVLVDIMQTGANDVYVVENEEKKEFLLPSIKECILDINLERQQILVHVMKGLLDL